VYRTATAILAWSLFLSPALGARIAEFSPQGTVATVQEASLSFDQDVIAFGEGQAPAPVELSCNDPDLKGHGRWLDARRWSYTFEHEPGPGVACSATVRPDFRTLDNQAVAGTQRFSFRTGGPVASMERPWGDTIDEDQVFVLSFNGVVDADSVLAHTHCLVEGLGEAVPVRAIEGDERQALLRELYYDFTGKDSEAIQLLQCKRLLPSKARVQLVVGSGVSTPALPGRPAVAASKAARFDFTVREPFTVSFTCQRENSSMPCTPVSPVALVFSAPIAATDAANIRLEGGGKNFVSDIGDDNRASVSRVSFNGPFPEKTSLALSVPDGLKDDAGRALANADQFPLSFETAPYPPLVKFAAAPFGVIERFADVQPGQDEADHPATMALTVRAVEPALMSKDLALSAGKLSDYVTQDDAQVLKWYARVQRMNERRLTRGQIDNVLADRAPGQGRGDTMDTRGISLLDDVADARKLQLPAAGNGGARPFEVIGVPLDKPGFHVLEVKSSRLGDALLENKGSMYVRTAALLTNLGVHIKTGRDDTLVWVTTLDDGKVVPDAQVTVLNCDGALLAQGRTDDSGVWHQPRNLAADTGYCDSTGLSGIYASARIGAGHPMARGRDDFSFAFSSWDEGIESWRFNVPTDTSPAPTLAVHTVFDRSLLRAGETVSMKHFVRVQTRDGMALPEEAVSVPRKLVIQHQGSDQRYEQPVNWIPTVSGGMYATSALALPRTAKLGLYSVSLVGDDGDWYGNGEFRVEEFKLPLLAGHIKLSAKGQDGAAGLVAPRELDADLQVNYVAGGPAGKLAVSVSGMARDRYVQFRDYDDYSFDAPSDGDAAAQSREDEARQVLFMDKKPVTLDAQGGGRLRIDQIPASVRPRELLLEASFFDPNGELQTLSQTVPVWPASVQAGIAAGSWIRAGTLATVRGLALSTSSQPQAGVAMTVRAVARDTYSTRKRMVGGFYSYDNHTEMRDLGQVCEGKTGKDGKLDCSINLTETGSVDLIATATDAEGRESKAVATVWVTGADDLWFGGANDDRIDIIPARKEWKPGETAEFQVRMPFRHATALVAVEREGVLETHVAELDGSDPTVRLPVKAEWGPNVYVSVLALRGRIRKASWGSFFDWGWRAPRAWYEAFRSKGEPFAAPTPFVDLSKPSFRFGLAEIRVSDERDQLRVEVKPARKAYQVRDNVTVDIQVRLPDGKPAAHGTVAFAAVDEALLELAPNTSWNLLAAMRQERSYGVQTATAQMQVVGRRHYGRKALPAGGGGGKSPTRELLDTLLLWEPVVELDGQGKATVTFPLNDALTRFRLVAIADYGAQRFGTGSADIVSTQDLQVIPGLPSLVREGDSYRAIATLRNTTDRAMALRVQASYEGKGVDADQLAARQIEVPAGDARTVSWDIQAPESNLFTEATTLVWSLDAREMRSDSESAPAADRLVFRQRLLPSVPVRTRQSTLLALESGSPATDLPISVPAGARKDADGRPRGGLQVHVQTSLAAGLPGVREWLRAYPYTCLEQRSAQYIGLDDKAGWQALMASLPDYLDEDGLAAYFPGGQRGSEVLTAYLLAVSHEAQALGRDYGIPQASRDRMIQGLESFAQGKLTRERWAPMRDLDLRKLMALEALSRYGRAMPRMLDSIEIAPERWPTSALIDWMGILQRVENIPDRGRRLEEVRHALRARMSGSGTGLAFADSDRNDSWWLMSGPQANMAKFMLLALNDRSWDDDMPRLASGLLSMQRRGAWDTTTANLLGTLAIGKFAARFEREPVSGAVELALASGERKTIEWRQTAGSAQGLRSGEVLMPWRDGSSDTLSLSQQGHGTAWATVSSVAAVPASKPVSAGYRLAREVTPVSQAVPGKWSRGDVYRVRLEVAADAPMSWVALADPLPAGATILGSGLGRDSAIATAGEEPDDASVQPDFVERSFEAYRAYFEYLPKGRTVLEYTARLNTPGVFALPATRIEALYKPDVYGELPNDGITVEQAAGGGS